MAKHSGSRPLTAIRIFIALAVCASTQGPPASASTPLDIPIPTEVSVEDLLSTSTDSGDVGGIPGADACGSAPHDPISLPADESPHNGTELESWWWYGHLAAADGRRFEYVIAFASKPSVYFYAVDSSITDLSNGSYHYHREALLPGLPSGTDGDFDLRGKQSSAKGADGHAEIRFRIEDYEVALSLEPNPTKPPIPEFEDGYVTPYCQSNYMYSRVRMPTIGTLTRGGEVTSVVGTSTLHHQWGFIPGEGLGVLSYDFMTFELDDGRDIHVAIGSAKRTPLVTAHTGYISDTEGNVTPLHRGDFTMTPTRYWTRDATCSYPVEWDVTVRDLHLHTRASVDGSELRATNEPLLLALWPSWAVSWDGETIVTGDAAGRGSLDMLGYCLY